MKIYTDGGCINNGLKTAKAAYAAYSPNGGAFKELSGLLRPYNYILTFGKINVGPQLMPPTNIRAEMFAIIMALNVVKHRYGSQEIEIITDSEFTINVLTKWLPEWEKKNIVHKKANTDLLYLIGDLYKFHKVKLTHQKSHTNEKTENARGNNYVDALVTKALNTFVDYGPLII